MRDRVCSPTRADSVSYTVLFQRGTASGQVVGGSCGPHWSRAQSAHLPRALGETTARLCAATTSSTSTTGRPWAGTQGQKAPFRMLAMMPTDSPPIFAAHSKINYVFVCVSSSNPTHDLNGTLT